MFGTNVMVSVAKSFDAPIKRKWMFKWNLRVLRNLIFFVLLSNISTRFNREWSKCRKVCSIRSRWHCDTGDLYRSFIEIRYELEQKQKNIFLYIICSLHIGIVLHNICNACFQARSSNFCFKFLNPKQTTKFKLN